MRLFSRLGLFAVIALSTLLTESAEAQLFPIFKCRKKACCEAPAPEPVCCPVAEEPEPCPEPEPVCCPEPAPEPEPVCCPEPAPEPEPVCCPEPAPEPEPVCCPEPEPAPEPVCCPAPVCEVIEPEPAAPVCCESAAMEIPAAASPTAELATEYGMPELAEGETLVSISPIEVPTDSAATMTSTKSE